MNWNKILDFLSYQPSSPLLFNSGAFLMLFLGFYGIFILFREKRLFRTIYVIIFSLFFYYKASGFYFWILIASTILDYYVGILLFRTQKKSLRKVWLMMSLLFNLGILSWFKYTNFFIDTWGYLNGVEVSRLDIFLPVGISFYTFQTLSYSIDIYRRKIEPARNLLDFGFYVCFFPQLVAGPIVRAADFLPQMYQKLQLGIAGMGRAWWLILTGLIKKAIISDYISINFVDRVFDNPALYSGFENLMAVYAYAIQIYCDFSGYSDIAIGLALLMGFRLPENFRSPYQAISITDFWRRWHISLSSWLRDYLYISLGGNRKTKLRTYANLLITMLLGGLWHGASWKFVVWGGLHGLGLAWEKFMGHFGILPKGKIGRIIGWIATLHFVCFGWIFFRARDFDTAFLIISRIMDSSGWAQATTIMLAQWKVFALIFVGFLTHMIWKSWKIRLREAFVRLPMVWQALAIAGTCWLIFQVASSEVQAFIYFQF